MLEALLFAQEGDEVMVSLYCHSAHPEASKRPPLDKIFLRSL